MVEELPSGEEFVPTPALLFCPYRSGDCLKETFAIDRNSSQNLEAEPVCILRRSPLVFNGCPLNLTPTDLFMFTLFMFRWNSLPTGRVPNLGQTQYLWNFKYGRVLDDPADKPRRIKRLGPRERAPGHSPFSGIYRGLPATQKKHDSTRMPLQGLEPARLIEVATNRGKTGTIGLS